jgi:hypothetical protein
MGCRVARRACTFALGSRQPGATHRENTYKQKSLHKSSIGGVYFSMKRSLAVIAVLTIAFVLGSMVYFASSTRQPGHVDGLKILTAARTYTASLRAEGLPVPASVSLQELINRRLLTASDVNGFAGMEVTVNLSADDTRPQDVLIRAHLGDGQEIMTLADGSVQQLSPNRGR